ncbi:MATE family efflux transporter [Swingsia samuiensis]|uniref:Multidrug-efflux transporter n=1 Tax=Swingsia samuiensis TaxID=1293412 RepID=A0A4Y6UM71_9PROT|nr:MATE family efflux transporter [Swingsia samuiensis]QDH17491.1 MATE family efflux transporter [Swingsia samuiensis]
MHKKTTNPTSISGHITALMRIALPLAFSQLSEMSMGVTDTILLGSLGVTEVAIGGLAGTFFFTTMVTCQALLGGGGVLLSHGRGAEDYGHKAYAGKDVVTAIIFLGLLIFVPCALLLWFVEPLFTWLGEPHDVVVQGSQFIHILLISLLPYMTVIGAVRVILPALGAEALLLWMMPAMAICNGLANATLIYGWFGIPAFGLFGSATATTLTAWILSIAMLALCKREPRIRSVMHVGALDWSIVKELLQLGVPMMFGAAAEILMFQITSLRAGELGTHSSAAHQVVINIGALMFMVSLAIGQATNVRVAYWRGAGKLNQSRRATIWGTIIVLIWGACASSLLLIWPDKILSLYFSHHPADPETAQLVVLLLKIAGIYQIGDGLQTVFNGALRGYGDTIWPMILAVLSYGLVGLALGGWLAFQQHWGVEGLWVGMALALGVTSLGFGARLLIIMRSYKRTQIA